MSSNLLRLSWGFTTDESVDYAVEKSDAFIIDKSEDYTVGKPEAFYNQTRIGSKVLEDDKDFIALTESIHLRRQTHSRTLPDSWSI